MPRYTIRYPKQRDPAEEARKQAAEQRQERASAYAAAKFQEWQATADEREQALQLRIQNLQSESELKGAQFKYNLWKDNELRRQTTAYYTAMPALQESLKQAGIYPGSQRYAAEMAAFAAEIPDAVTHNESIRKDLQDYSRVDLTAGEISGKVQTLREGMQEADQKLGNVHLTKGGEIIGEASPELPERVIQRYAKLQGNIKQHLEQSEVQKQEHMSQNLPNTPYSKAAELHADQTEAAILASNYPKLNIAAQQSQKKAQAATPSPTPAGTQVVQPPSLDDIWGQQQQTP